MIKKLVLIFGIGFLITLNIKLQFDKIQLIKTQNSMQETIEAFKVSNEGYQTLIKEIISTIGRECPEIFKGPSHSPELKSPSSNLPNRDFPEINLGETISPEEQEYKINGLMPKI